VLQLVLGDDGRLQKAGDVEVGGFKDYFGSRFFGSFERTVRFINGIELKLPGRDFNISCYNGTAYVAAARGNVFCENRAELRRKKILPLFGGPQAGGGGHGRAA
jgi:hypothetical protein